MTRCIQFTVLFMFVVVGCDARNTAGILGTGTGQSGPIKAGPLASWHFVGAASLSGNTNATRLQKVLSEPSTRNLVDDVVKKFARATTNLVPANARLPGGDHTSLIAPLIRDILDHESAGVVSLDVAGHSLQLDLAIKLPPQRASVWLANLKKALGMLGATAPSEVQFEVYKGIEAKWDGTACTVRVLEAGNWLLLSWGSGAQSMAATWLARIKSEGRPVQPDKEAWLAIQADLERTAELLNWSRTIAWPQTKLQVVGRGPNLRTVAQMTYSRPPGFRVEPWRIPTNTISEPLVSFTAIQGLRPWLSSQQWVKDSGVKSVPNQLFVWGQAHIPFRTYMAWEMEDMSDSLQRLARYLPSAVTNHLYWTRFAFIDSETNKLRYVWRRLPIVEPFVQQAPTADKGFVMAGIFPPDTKVVPAPQELYAQIIGRTNLLYYDWELSQVRVDDWRRMKEVYWMIAGYESLPTNSAVRLWLADTNVFRHLDNAVTEVTCTSPAELNLVRSSSVGFTSLELVLIARWLEDPGFPRLTTPQINPSFLRLDRTKPAATNPAPARSSAIRTAPASRAVPQVPSPRR
ncbi:MAG TPA: hypothetical protein PLW35_10195 [Verrucomicrobiota bacterium]|nr:hypothetical protein [Verrucomicrobiota bacterium]